MSNVSFVTDLRGTVSNVVVHPAIQEVRDEPPSCSTHWLRSRMNKREGGNVCVLRLSSKPGDPGVGLFVYFSVENLQFRVLVDGNLNHVQKACDGQPSVLCANMLCKGASVVVNDEVEVSHRTNLCQHVANQDSDLGTTSTLATVSHGCTTAVTPPKTRVPCGGGRFCFNPHGLS